MFHLNSEYSKKMKNYYRREINRFYKSIIPNHKNVMEIGPAMGNLLNNLNPSHGIVINKSPEEAENYNPDIKFDYVIIPCAIEYTADLYNFFNALRKKVSSETKIIITNLNPFWKPIINLAAKLGVSIPGQQANFVSRTDVENILNLLGYEIIKSGYRVALPINLPFISRFLNKILPRLPIIRNICLVQYIVARLKRSMQIDYEMGCSVIIPCHNEEGNIKECIERMPAFGIRGEIIVIDDGSKDNTSDVVRGIQKTREDVRLISYTPNKGKGSAVRAGFEAASQDIIMILDADMAVAPEELVRFYEVLASHQAEFVNGTRMIYKMAPGAMKFINYLGNKAFGIILSFITGQRNTDTLCGTKAFYKKDYKNFKMGKCPWGDFDLLFESERLKLKTVEMPVHYYPRLQGESKMKAFKHGMMLLKMCWYGFWYLD